MSRLSSDQLPSDDELRAMSPQQLEQLGYRLDDLEVVNNRTRWPISGTRAEKRTERQVASWFALSAVSGIAFIAIYLFWPWHFVPPGAEGEVMYSLYTPLIGTTFGLAILGLGVGAIAYSKKLLPEDETIQQRHDGPSSELDRRTTAARFTEEGRKSGIARRSLIKRTAGLGAGVFGLGTGILAIGGLVRDPFDGEPPPLYVTGWASPNGEPVFLRYATEELTLARPEDLSAGAIAGVVPYRESWTEEEASEALHAADNPVMLIRFRPDTPMVFRKGQEDFHYGDYVAYSKICTHMGCPASLFESQTLKLVCPCHQSQFLANEYARPVFGPATRALPQLPITVNDEGYFIARSDFIEPVGPAFWELDA
ncbi:MAG: ubiquinol-cytochrome c reductase iron-sulfur subunit [Actinomycetota bacterium]|nr:ubiquinol-cytochrome c reductase iron-sulfur subunit [Actinomycetota bacterium]